MIARLKENATIWLAYHLPRDIAYWAAIRVMTHASIVNPTTTVSELSPADCLKAWKQ